MKYKGRAQSSNIEDRRVSNDSLANAILGKMKRDRMKKRNEDWDTLMSPERISPTSMKFEKKMSTKDHYSFQKKGK